MIIMTRTILTAFIICFLVSCSGGNISPDDALKKDLSRYLTLLSKVSNLEAEADEENKKATSAPNANDAAYARDLKNKIIPKLEEFLGELSKIHPATNDVIGMHKNLIRRIKLQIKGFKELELGGSTGNQDAIERAKALFIESKLYYDSWAEQMKALSNRYLKTEEVKK